MKSIDGSTWKAVVFGEEERQDFIITETAIRQQRDDSRNETVRAFFLRAKEGFWDVADTIAADHDEFVVIDQVHHLGDNNSKAFCCLWEGQQWLIVGQGERGFIVGTHSFNLAGSRSN